MKCKKKQELQNVKCKKQELENGGKCAHNRRKQKL